MPRIYLPNGKSVYSDKDIADEDMDEFIEFHMADDEPIEDTVDEPPIQAPIEESPKRGFLGQALDAYHSLPDVPTFISEPWDKLSAPSTEIPTNLSRQISSWMAKNRESDTNPLLAGAKGFYEGAVEGLGDYASGMTSAANIGLSLIPGVGPTLARMNAARKTIDTAQKIANPLMKLAGIGSATHGADTILDPTTDGMEKLFGALELVGGGAAAKMGLPARPNNIPRPGVAASIDIPIIESPSIQSVIPDDPRLIQARATIDEYQPGSDISKLTPEETIQLAEAIDPSLVQEAIPEAISPEVIPEALPPPDITADSLGAFDQNTGEVIDTSIQPEVIPPAMVEPPIIEQPTAPIKVIPKNPNLPPMVVNSDGTFSPSDKPHIKLDGAGKRVGRPTVQGIPEDINLRIPKDEKLKTPKTPEDLAMWQEALQMPRAIMASIDLPPFRQGLPMITNKAWWTSWDDMIRSYGSEAAFDVVDSTIKSEPLYDAALKAGVKFTDLVNKSEESFSSKIANKYPGVRRSNRAHVAFLNKMRMDSFKNMYADMQRAAKQPDVPEAAGLGPEVNDVLVKQLAEFVNDATGRGSLSKLEPIANGLNTLFFSPRLIASRVRMYNRYLNPLKYAEVDPVIRQETLKSLIGTAGVWIAAGGLAKAAGADVSLDPTNSDFGKIRIGNFRMDPAGGFQQYITAVARVAYGGSSSTDTKTGKSNTNEHGQSYGGPTDWSTIERFGANKLNPSIAFIYNILNAAKNKPVAIGDSALKMVTPIILQDLIQILQEDPRLLPTLLPAALGMGSNIYGERGVDRIVPPDMDIEYTGKRPWSR